MVAVLAVADQLPSVALGRALDQVGPVASFKRVVVTNRLPKTRSGKILRRTIRAMAEGEEVKIPSTIEDPAALWEARAIPGRQEIVCTFGPHHNGQAGMIGLVWPGLA